MSADLINDAVNRCLKRCYTSSNPLATLVQFIGELRADDQWLADDIDRVETNARRILLAVLDVSESA